MRQNLHPAVALVLLAAVLAAGFYGLHRYRYRFVQSRQDLVERLPANDATVFFADVELLRQSGLLGLFADSPASSEPDYRRFIRETGFDYARDLDALAGSYRTNQIALLAQGRFDWTRLRHYASTHGGFCTPNICAVAGSQPDRWISYGELQPDVLAIAVGENRKTAAQLLAANPSRSAAGMPDAPIWLQPAHSVFQAPNTLPVPLQLFALPLQAASNVVLSANRSQTPGDAFALRLEAQFPNSATADSARRQFESNSKMITAELAREHAQPNSADLSGLLTSGVFQAIGNHLVAQWPIKHKLLQSLR